MANIPITNREKEDLAVDGQDAELGEWEALEQPDQVVEKSKQCFFHIAAVIRLTSEQNSFGNLT